MSYDKIYKTLREMHVQLESINRELEKEVAARKIRVKRKKSRRK